MPGPTARPCGGVVGRAKWDLRSGDEPGLVVGGGVMVSSFRVHGEVHGIGQQQLEVDLGSLFHRAEQERPRRRFKAVVLAWRSPDGDDGAATLLRASSFRSDRVVPIWFGRFRSSLRGREVTRGLEVEEGYVAAGVGTFRESPTGRVRHGHGNLYLGSSVISFGFRSGLGPEPGFGL